MNSTTYDIIFRGDIVLGHQLAQVKLKLQQLFKVDAAKVDALFSGRPVPLKRQLDQATAEKYRAVLLQAGAQVDICPSADTAVVKPAAPVAAAAKVDMAKPAAPLTATKSAAPTDWSLAPTGADLLSAQERKPQPAVNVDISSLSLRAAEGNLLDAAERVTAPAAQVQVPHFDVAEAGTLLLAEDEKLGLPLPDITLEDWGLAAPGSALLEDSERAPTAAPVVVVDFGLAPVGSDLEQLKPQVKAVVPDISKLHLAD
jgi:hypothetical protein